MAHAKIIQPSKAARLLACPGSAALEVGLPPDEGNEAADRGTLLHNLAHEVLIGEAEPEGADYLDVQQYVEWINFYLDVTPDSVAYFEETLDISAITGEEDGSGTPDAVIVAPDELVIVDLKTGRVPVLAEWNVQLMIYALAALLKYGRRKRVRLVIVQPFAGGSKEWVIGVSDLFDWRDQVSSDFGLIIWLHQQPHEARPSDFKPGDEQCRYCPAAKWLKCKVYDRAVFEVVTDQAATDADFAEFVPAFDVGDLAVKYKALALVEGWIEHVRMRMLNALTEGQAVPGYYLGKGKLGNRKWKDEKEVAQKYSFLYTQTVMSPTEAERLKKARVISKAQWAELKEHIMREEGKPKVCEVGSDEPKFDMDIDFTEIF